MPSKTLNANQSNPPPLFAIFTPFTDRIPNLSPRVKSVGKHHSLSQQLSKSFPFYFDALHWQFVILYGVRHISQSLLEIVKLPLMCHYFLASEKTIGIAVKVTRPSSIIYKQEEDDDPPSDGIGMARMTHNLKRALLNCKRKVWDLLVNQSFEFLLGTTVPAPCITRISLSGWRNSWNLQNFILLVEKI